VQAWEAKGYTEALRTPDTTLVDRVVITMVTAQTQTRKLGGDLDGDGGHFHKIAPVNGEWQTVEIPFSDFERPTWGVSAMYTTLALDRLQALDFGVSDRATNFDLLIDDIELY